MKVLFCKITCMKYYKGACDKDIPSNGGSFVDENGFGHEEHNFNPIKCSDGEDFCLGFFETKSTSAGKSNDLHIEKIADCEGYKNEPFVDDVLVIWCATIMPNKTAIVGWYNHATVYRSYQTYDFGDGCVQTYNVAADKKDCVLIPKQFRTEHNWCDVPVARKKGYGFGQSLVWFPTCELGTAYAEKKARLIAEYKGENWIDVFPE